MAKNKKGQASPDPELLQALMKGEFEELRSLLRHLINVDHERGLLLTAHLVIERILGAMIETVLSHPKVWTEDADFRSKTNLARAMGLIGDDELAICRVLNSARNEMAHKLDTLPEKWKVELERRAFGRRKKGVPSETDLAVILMELIIRVAAPWLYARHSRALNELRNKHGERWQAIMAQKLRERPSLLHLDVKDPLFEEVVHAVELDLAKELSGGFSK